MSEQPVRQTVLIVDDNAANVELIQAYLAGTGWAVQTARSGAEAVAKAAACPPDVVLLDLMMPGMSGYDVCRRLKTDAQTGDVPVIVVTALTEVEAVEKAIDAGADDFLSKPVNRLELITRVKSSMSVRHLRGQLARTLAYLDAVNKAARPG
jgi:two-component system alkaline phosphatase synthesis response regulator PhoP